MLKRYFFPVIIIALLIPGCNDGETNKDKLTLLPSEELAITTLIDSIVYTSDNLVIRKISGNAYEHTSYLQTNDFGKVSCNGMVVTDNMEAIVFDTPTDSISSEELIRFFTTDLKINLKAIIPTHFHTDCVGGLNEFHKQGVPSFASEQTRRILQEKNADPIPQNGFKDSMELLVGTKKVFAGFFGEGHTIDNIVGYFPENNVLFGGCLVKEEGAGKGNLEDANVSSWAATVQKLKQRFPKIQVVIPGHGRRGGSELFDYTIELFSTDL